MKTCNCKDNQTNYQRAEDAIRKSKERLVRRCGNVNTEGHVCELKLRHTGRHSTMLDTGYKATWQWGRHQTCHILVGT